LKPDVATYLNYTGNIANPVVNMYTTDVQFGNPIQNTTGYNFVVDSTVKQIMAISAQGSSWNMTYNNSASVTAKNDSSVFTKNIYGGRQAKGYEVEDTLCTLSNLICVNKAKFFAITSGPNGGKESFPNLFGIAPNDENEDQSAPAYVQLLKEAGAIKSTATGLFLNPGSTLEDCTTCSLISFGVDNVQSANYVQGSWYSHAWDWTSDLDERMATVKMTKGLYGSTEFAEQGEIRAMIATTRPNLITFGKSQKAHYDAFAAKITQQYGSSATCGVVAGTNAEKCSLRNYCSYVRGELESIKLTLDDISYTIPSSSFTMDVVEDMTEAPLCDLGVQYDEDATNNIALIGIQFVQQFVTLFDYENNRLRFGMNVNALTGVQIVGPSDDDKANGMSTGQKFFIWMLVISLVLITLVLVVYVIRCSRKSRSRQDASAIAYQSVADGRV